MPAAFPMVDYADIMGMVGSGAFARARPYSRNGAVTNLEWNSEQQRLSAQVKGSDLFPYYSWVTLKLVKDNLYRPTTSTCSCPMAFDCKHVAAVMLASNAEAVEESVPAALRLPGQAPGQGQPQPQPRPEQEPQHQPSDATWKTALASITGWTAGEPSGARMGLLFELRELVRRSRSQWNAPIATTARRPLDPAGVYRLAVRPVIQSSTGNWVRGNLTWNSIGYQVNRLELRTEQLRWFAEFAALARATRDVYVGQEADWLYLDDFQSPLLWKLLDDSARLGITLVVGKKDTNVRLGSVARVGLDVSAGSAIAAPAEVHLRVVIEVDGEPREAASTGLIGSHGLYTFALDPRPTFTLAPIERRLTDEERQLVVSRASLTVPASDAHEFLSDYLPSLRRVVDVRSADASVQLPELPSPTLVITATFAPKHMLHLAWTWENGVGELPAQLENVPATLQGLDAAEFTSTVLPELERLDHVRVDSVGDRPDYRELTEAPRLTITTVETDKRDWFDLGVLVTVEGRTIAFAPLFAALSTGAQKLLLIDNSYLSLAHPAFDELKRLLEEADSLNEWETGPRISRYQASFWADLEELADSTEQAVAWRNAVSGLNDLPLEPVPLPAVSASLRPYQVDGFGWLAFLWRHRLGGILADDMGLGKTLQTIALIAHAVSAARQSGGPFLVVAPTSVVPNWLGELERFAPHLLVRGITSSREELPTDVDVVVTSYALFRLNFDAYQKNRWAGLILDEAQFVKNPASKAHKCAVDLNTDFKLALTGTPMENSLIDLWALFRIVAPGLFPSSTRFTEQYVKPIVAGNPPLLAQLRRRIRPLMMRRTKELVASDLPAKQEQVLTVDLAPKHRKLYDAFLQKERRKLLGLIDDLDRNRFIVFRSLTLLRLLSLDASLVDPAYADVPSSKLDALFEQLGDVVAEGHRALIFSQFTSFLGLARDRLDAEGIDYEYLDGSTLRRADVIARFKNGTAPVFLISLKAGGFGLNLTEADYVFLLDPWWNPATESQAVDRTHRIGQSRNVMVYRLVARGTIEEKVMALKETKARLFDAVMDDDAVFSAALTADDVRSLLE